MTHSTSPSPPTFRTLLLLPSHVQVTPTTLALLQSLQSLLNISYATSYCAQPSIFGTDHVRIADPAQLVDIISPDGFTVALLLVREDDGEQRGGGGEGRTQVVDVVATGSVKNFGDGDVTKYASWSRNVSGAQWAAKKSKDSERIGNAEKARGKVESSEQGERKPSGGEVKMEVTAFAVSPQHQGLGLGARVLAEIEWLVGAFGSGFYHHDTYESRSLIQVGEEPPAFEGAVLSSATSEPACPILGIDVDKLRHSFESGLQDLSVGEGRMRRGVEGEMVQKLVLMGIRELGNEAYYKRRGYRSVWSGTVPVGMWSCLEECTMVYMEKDIPILGRVGHG